MKHEILHVKLESGDEAVMVDGKMIYATDLTESDMVISVANVARRLSEALGVPVRYVSMQVPSDSDWVWDDVAELVPPFGDQRDLQDLQMKFPGLALCDGQSVFDGDDGKWISVSVKDMAITNPFVSECGRFDVDPAQEYGLAPDAAKAIYEANCLRAKKVPTHIWQELSSWEVKTENGTAWRRDFPKDGHGYCLITGFGSAKPPENPETWVMLIAAYDEHDVLLASHNVAGRVGLNNWYEKAVGYRPDEDAGKDIPMPELLTLVAERIYLDASNKL